MGGIEPILQTSQGIGFRLFSRRIGLSLTDDLVGGNLLTEKIGSLRPQVVSNLASLPHAFRIQSIGVAALLLCLPQAGDHGLDAGGCVADLRGRLQASSQRLQRGVTAMFADALQRGQPI